MSPSIAPCRLPGYVRRPVAVERRPDRAPPEEERAEDEREQGEPDKGSAQEQRRDGREAERGEQTRGERPRAFRRRKAEPQRQGPPGAGRDDDENRNEDAQKRSGGAPSPPRSRIAHAARFPL